LHGYVDGELDLLKNVEMEEHLQQCSACAQAHRSILSLRAAIRNESSYYEPPAGLQARIRTAVRGASRGSAAPRLPAVGWLAVAASVAVVVIATWSLIRFFPYRTDTTVLT